MMVPWPLPGSSVHPSGTPILTELSGADTVCSLPARAERPPAAGPEASRPRRPARMPLAEEPVQHGVHGRAKARRIVRDQGRFDLIGAGGSGDEHARHLFVPLRVVDHREEDRDGIRAAHLEDPSHLRPFTAVVMHDAQHSFACAIR